MPVPTFEDWLARCRAITMGHFKRNGGVGWALSEQIAHAHSEVSEVYQAKRKGEGPERVLEEICDSILASITMAHVAGFTDAEIDAVMETTLQKCEGRVGLGTDNAGVRGGAGR